jgi:hypothetical protein
VKPRPQTSQLGTSFSPAYTHNLRRDFLNAREVQCFVAHNQKLHRILLPHRVELYIRINNSLCGPLIFYGTGQDNENHSLFFRKRPHSETDTNETHVSMCQLSAAL